MILSTAFVISVEVEFLGESIGALYALQARDKGIHMRHHAPQH